MLLNRYQAHEQVEIGTLVHGDTADVLVVFLKDDVVRVRVSFNRDFTEESYTLVQTAWPDRMDELLKDERTRIAPVMPRVSQTDGLLVFESAAVRLEMTKDPLHFTLKDHEGNILHRDLRERAFEKDHLGRLFHYVAMDRANDHYYGFGEKTGHVDKKGRRMRMNPKDAIGHDPENGDPMYKHIPFYIKLNGVSKRPVGLFYHNSHDCVFDMGQEISGYWEKYSYYEADGGDIDLFLLAGRTMRDILRQYTDLTGRMAMPTKQSLGYCASTMYYAELDENCDEEIYKVIDKHEKEDIYIDNFWLASGYSAGEEDKLRYVFNWNKKRFPKPKEFFDRMNARGINVIPNLKPGILKRHPYVKDFEQADAFIKTPDGTADYYGRWWGGKGRFVDFTGEKGRAVWKRLLKANILEMGTKTVWNDNCELDGVEDRTAQCDFEGKKGTMAGLKIMHANLMAYLARQAIEEVYPGERPYIINRAGFAGIQRYAQVWGGDNLTDWRTLKFNIATILGMGLSGCANMGCDIGGFTGPAPEGELLLRWIQQGIFQPRFTLNSANTDNTVTQPWMYKEHLPLVRQAYALRYRLLPYFYALMDEAHRTGVPLWRPLFLEFPEDEKTYADEHMTFMLGASVLVANVVEKGAASRTLYLPRGTAWYDMNDDLKAYQGGETITVPVTPASIPMFLRGDALLPTSKDVTKITRDVWRHMDLLLACDKGGTYTLYDDDGHTKAFEQGHYNRTVVTVKAGAQTKLRFEKQGDYPDTLRTLQIRMVSKDKGAYWVTVNGQKLPQFMVEDAYDAAEAGWYYNLSDRTVMVKFVKPGQDFDVVISTEKFDLIGMSED